MKVEKFTKDEWCKFAEDAHLICFNEKIDPREQYFDFALMAVKDMEPQAYMTCRNTAKGVVYLQYGGAFPSSKGTTTSFVSYLAMLKALKDEGFVRGITYIENTNRSMLRFALKAGWIVTGVRCFDGSVLLEQTLRFENLEV